MQRVSGFVPWPCDYSAINKGWEGNIDEIPPPMLSTALWLFSIEAGYRDDTQRETCQPCSSMLVSVKDVTHLNT